jgi:hypothetical protein
MISLSLLKDALNIERANGTHDAYLVELEGAAVAYVQRRTGWYLGEPDTVNLIVEGGGGGSLWLPERVSAVSAVSSQPYEGGPKTVITSEADDGWTLRLPPGATHGRRLIRTGGHGWTRGLEYVVTAEIGYDPGMEPEEDRNDVKALVVHWFENRIPVVTSTVAVEVPLHVAERLRSRQRVRI